MKTRKAKVFNNKLFAGYLAQDTDGYSFTYDEKYLLDPRTPPISVTLPKSGREYHSKNLFPFFFGLLAEGEEKALQCRLLRIGERDHFTRLLKTAHTETIGSVTVREVPSNE
jgi:HipA-like protein